MNEKNGYKIFIDGREGTTGLQIERRLANRKDITLLTLPDALRKDPTARQEQMANSDITVLCLPDEAAKEAALFAPKGTRIADASSAHRTQAGWQYGFAELGANFLQGIANSDRVAVPGCHASGFIALVYPLVQLGILKPDALLSCFSLTGYSGGGKKMIANYQNPALFAELESPSIYALSQSHKHLPEMQTISGLTHAPVFAPTVCNYYCGMLVSVPLHTASLVGITNKNQIVDALGTFYDNNGGLVTVHRNLEPAALSANTLQHTDGMELFVTGNHDRVMLNARYDNLGKGASGAAVQCLNIMLSLPQTLGLSQTKQ